MLKALSTGESLELSTQIKISDAFENKTAATFQHNMLEHTIERRHNVMNIGAVDKIYHSAENMQDNLLANLPSGERGNGESYRVKNGGKSKSILQTF